MPNALEWVTGIGQIGAVALAAWAAKSAADSAKSAQESTSIAQLGVEAQERPLLLDVPYENYTDHEHEMLLPNGETRKTAMRGEIHFDNVLGTFSIPVRNVGRGLARIESYALGLHSEPSTMSTFDADVALPIGEETRLTGTHQADSELRARLATTPSPLHQNGAIALEVVYTDYRKAQRQRLELRLGGLGRDSAWRVLHAKHVDLDV